MNRYLTPTFGFLSLCLMACGDDGGRTTGSTGTASSTSAGTGTASGTDSASGSGGGTTSGSGGGTMSGSGGSGGSGGSAGSGGSGGSGGSAGSGGSGGSGTGSTSGSGTAGSTSTATSGGTTSGSSGSGGMIMPCDTASAMLEPIPPNIMLVVDKSGSMVSNSWDHDQNAGTPVITRWESLYNVVDFIVTTFDAQINFGATLFPSLDATNTLNATACPVNAMPEEGVAPNNAANVLAAIPGPMSTGVEIKGGTPSQAGMQTGITHLKAQDPANPRAVIFITDGAANCQTGLAYPQLFNVYDDTLHTTVSSAWTTDQIPTYVVGIDISTMNTGNTQDGTPDNIVPYDKLNQLATEGGKPLPGNEKFYQTNNQIELQMAMDDIIQSALSCTVPLNPVPAFPELMEVIIGNMTVPKVMDCATEDGWVFTNPMGPYDSIELCGTWCDSLKMEGGLTAEYYCKPG